MFRIASMIMVLAMMVGCESTGDTPAATTQLQTIAKGQAGTTAVEVLADHGLHMGWQTLRIRVTQDGKAVTQAAVRLQPVMKMAMDQHACPLVQPATVAGTDGMFNGEAGLQMASGEGMGWSLAVDVTPVGGTAAHVDLGSVAVASAPWMKPLLAAGTEDARYVVGLDLRSGPMLGKHPYRLSLHQASADLMTFAPVDDATVTAELTMPSMGHGSPGNVPPTSAGGGFYAGQLNQTMLGDWRLRVTIVRAGKSLGTVSFDWTL